jgi:hypothetical protein
MVEKYIRARAPVKNFYPTIILILMIKTFRFPYCSPVIRIRGKFAHALYFVRRHSGRVDLPF